MSRAFEVAQILNRNKVSDNPQQEVPRSVQVARILNQSKNEQSLQKPTEHSTKRFLAEQIAKGALDLADLPQNLIETIAAAPRSPLMYPEYEQEYGIEPTQLNLPKTSAPINKFLNNRGIDLETQSAQNPMENMLGKGARFLGSTVAGGGLGTLSKALGAAKVGKFLGAPSAPTALGKVAELSKNAATSATAGGISGGLEELGAGPLTSDVIGAISGPLLAGGVSRIGKGGYHTARSMVSPEYAREHGKNVANKQLSNMEDIVSGKIKRELGQELPGVEESLRNYTPDDYPLTTAELTGNTRLSQLQRAAMGSDAGIPISKRHEMGAGKIKQEVEKLGKEGASLEDVRGHYDDLLENLKKKQQHELHLAETSRNEALEKFSPKLEPDVAGAATQEFLSEKKRGIRRNAQKESSPHYEKAFKEKEHITPSGTLSYIEKAREVESQPIVDILNRIEKDITPPGGFPKPITPQERSIIERAEKLGQKVPEGLVRPEGGALVEKLYSVEKNVKRMMQNTAPDDYNARRVYRDILQRLDSDMSKSTTSPHIKKAKEVYREKIEKFNELNESPVFKKVTKKVKGYSDRFAVNPSEVPSEFMKGLKSKDTSSELMKQISNNKEMVSKYRGAANKLIIDSFVDSSGVVNVKDYKSFVNSNPGLFKMFPDLSTRLKNSQNAQLYVNSIAKQNENVMNQFYKDSAKSVLDGDVNQMIPKIFQGNDRLVRVKEVMKNSAKDATGGSTEGIRLGTRDFLMRKMGTGSEWTHHKFKNVTSAYMPSFKEIYEPEQITALEKVGKYLDKKSATEYRGAMKGSQTAAHLANQSVLNHTPVIEGIGLAGGLKEYVKKVPGVKWFFQARKSIQEGVNESYRNIVGEFLADPNYAKAILLKPAELKERSSLIKSIKDKSFLAVPIVSDRVRKEEE